MDAEQKTNRLVAWIKDQVSTAGCRGVVLGISGGLDSSVLAVLCKQAFPQEVLGVIMPCYSHLQDKEHAEMLVEKFDIPTREVVLDSVYDSLLEALPALNPNPEIGRLSRANLKARLRMLTLYYAAGQLNYLVAGSSNRTEITIGYFTKCGDSGVDIMPLGGMVKDEVRKLARFLGIPKEIIDKPPSAGLWAGQTDEEEMGITYEVLDRFITSGEAPEEFKSKIIAMIAASEHKRFMPPIAEF
jgi:NAD+ synthase